MVTRLNMPKWSKEIEEDLTQLIKDWLKQQGRSQSELSEKLEGSSTRMSAIINVLEKEYLLGGISKVAYRLCKIEEDWSSREILTSKASDSEDPFGQLDLLLDEINEDCDS